MEISENNLVEKGREGRKKGWVTGYLIVLFGVIGIGLSLLFTFYALGPRDSELFRIISLFVIFICVPLFGIVTGFFIKNQASKIAIFIIITFTPIIWIGCSFFVWVVGFRMGAYPEMFLRSGFLGAVSTPLILLPIFILLISPIMIGTILGRKFEEKKLLEQ